MCLSIRERSRSFGVLASVGIFLFMLVTGLPVFAQTDTIDTEPSRGGVNSIQGHVYLPSGHRIERPIRVRLSSIRTGPMFTMSDSNGNFYFHRLPAGTYNVSVDAGQEFEKAEETVDIIDDGISRRSRAGQTVTVQIQLGLKSTSMGKAGVVNAAEAVMPKEARDLYEKAIKEAEAGESKNAIEDLQNAIKLYPNFALAYNELGVQRLKLGEAGPALEAFHTAHTLDPNAFVLHLNYGIALVKNKKFKDADSELQKVLEKNNASTTAHLYRGRALIGLKKYDQAEKELLTVVAAKPERETAQAYRYLGALYIQKDDTKRAVKALENFLALDPKDKDTDQVRQILEQLRSSNSDNKQ